MRFLEKLSWLTVASIAAAWVLAWLTVAPMISLMIEARDVSAIGHPRFVAIRYNPTIGGTAFLLVPPILLMLLRFLAPRTGKAR